LQRTYAIGIFGQIVMKNNGLEKNWLITGKIRGKRTRGQQWKEYVESMGTWSSKNITTLKLIKLSEDRWLGRSMLAWQLEEEEEEEEEECIE